MSPEERGSWIIGVVGLLLMVLCFYINTDLTIFAAGFLSTFVLLSTTVIYKEHKHD